MSGSGKGTEEPTTYFNDCVSKNELRAILDDKLNEILQQITNLAKRVEDVEQRRPKPHHEDEEEKNSKMRMLATLRLKPKHDM
jgi:hypothetical protein